MLRTEGAQQDSDGAIDFRSGLVEFAPLGEQLRHRKTGLREIGVAGSECALLRGERFFEQPLRAIPLTEIEFHPRLVAYSSCDTGMVVAQRGSKICHRGGVLIGCSSILRRAPTREGPIRPNRDGVDALFSSGSLPQDAERRRKSIVRALPIPDIRLQDTDRVLGSRGLGVLGPKHRAPQPQGLAVRCDRRGEVARQSVGIALEL